MKAAALATPVLALGLIHLMHLLEVWAQRTSTSSRTSPRTRRLEGGTTHDDKDETMTDIPGPRTDPSPNKPLPHDPPPPPGWVDPLADSDAGDLDGAAPSPPAGAGEPGGRRRPGDAPD